MKLFRTPYYLKKEAPRTKRYIRPAYHKLNNKRTWERRRRLHLAMNPLCVMCEAMGAVVAAEVTDHITPHRGDTVSFFTGELQSLCWRHHSSTKQQQEANGFARDIGVDGYPLDPNHPVYVKSKERKPSNGAGGQARGEVDTPTITRA